MLKADLHIHSEASYDGTASVESILERAKEKGLDAICITDHDEIHASLRASEIAHEFGLIAIPGVEISTSDGHLLALGVEEKPDPGNPIDDTMEKVRSLGGIAVVPHPFQETRHGAGPIEDCDAMEVFNSRLLTGRANRQAKKFAQEHDIPEMGGSDAHSVKMVGRAYTEIELGEEYKDKEKDDEDPIEVTSGEILDAVKEGRTRARGKRTPLHITTRQFAKSAGRRAYKTVKYAITSFF